MAFPTTSLLDDLTYSNGNLSGKGSWLGEIDNSGSQLRIVSNHIENQSGGGFNSNYYNVSYAADQEVYADLLATPTSNHRIIFYVRLQGPGTSTFDGYAVTFRTGVAPGVFIERVDNGVYTGVGTDSEPTIASGDKLGVEASGTTITAYHKPGAGAWTSRAVATSQSSYNTSGYLGLELSNTSNQIDNWSGGATSTGLSITLTSRLDRARSIFAPTVFPDQFVTQTTRLDRVRSIFAPQVKWPQTLTQTTRLDRVRSIFTPTLANAPVSITQAARLDRARSIFAPTITVGSVTLTLARVDRTRSIFAPSLVTGVQIALTRLDRTRVLNAVTFSMGAVQVSLTRLDRTRQLFAPTLSDGSTPPPVVVPRSYGFRGQDSPRQAVDDA